MALSKDRAEIVGVQALGWLAGNEELLPIFLGSTGASTEDLRANVQEPEFLGSVLDFVLMDDAWVVAFCDAADIDYNDIANARAALPGGEQVHWT
ncbi:DUF3572 domain-containing protein [Primorskyibacter flagellatus]|uniref:DUF3572 family protein n=1 Tax=Primorskyibacter flagellatus TaxID=1387277 RepID=A0A1W2DRY7_9RHOB|nr:DUF3572 domain-containing protein [Primorskyibacter flagellatus]SMD00149.1 Protein of unknown function [Primorskyibacter flagellatus]